MTKERPDSRLRSPDNACGSRDSTRPRQQGTDTPRHVPPELSQPAAPRHGDTETWPGGLVSSARCLVNGSGMSGCSHRHQERHLQPLLLQDISSPVPHGLPGGDRAPAKPPRAPCA